MSSTALFDAPGPVMRRRVWIGSILAVALATVPVCIAIVRLADNGQFSSEKWLPFIEEEGMIKFLAVGLLNTLLAAAVALIFAMILGVVLAIGRMAEQRWLRRVSSVAVEVLRGAPVLLLMLFFFLAFPILFSLDFPAFWVVVLALTLFNGAVICEIIRAGIASLPGGQREAGYAIGMREMQTLRLILLPQAIRVMLPTLISQFIVLLKDTSLGFIIGYQELLQRGQAVQLLFDNPLQTFTIIAVVYILLNSAVSRASHWASARQQRAPKAPVAAKPVKALPGTVT